MRATVIKKEDSNIFLDADKQNILTYSSIGKKKSALVKKSNQLPIEGFTPRQQMEFDRGITIENYAKNKGINL